MIVRVVESARERNVRVHVYLHVYAWLGPAPTAVAPPPPDGYCVPLYLATTSLRKLNAYNPPPPPLHVSPPPPSPPLSPTAPPLVSALPTHMTVPGPPSASSRYT